MAEPLDHLHIIGPGRAGLALATALSEQGAVRRLTLAGRSPIAPNHPLLRGDPPAAAYHCGLLPPEPDSISGIILAVPDDRIAGVAVSLAVAGRVPPVALHLSGACGSELLRSLEECGVSTGSMHPLVALADQEAAAWLSGAWFAVEGAEKAEELAERVVTALGGRILRVRRERKPLYHAAAVTASNSVVALLAVAERWMKEAGVSPAEARSALTALAAGAVESVGRGGPVEALTGPVARGDAITIRTHLAQLSGVDRHLYSVLATSALSLARERGLDAAAAAELARVLEATE